MQFNTALAIPIALILSACGQGVEITQQNTASEFSETADPFYSDPSQSVDDSEARSFIPVTTTQPTMTIAHVDCVFDADTVTADEMSYTNGFDREMNSNENPKGAIRAKNAVHDNGSHYIEICVQVDEDADYMVQTRVNGPSVKEDSFFFTSGDSAPVVYDVKRSEYYANDFVRSRDTDPLRVSLRTGNNLLRFHYRERNTALAEVRFLPVPNDAPELAINDENSNFSAALLNCASATGQTPQTIAQLIEEHLPNTEFEFVFETNFNDFSLTHNYRIIDGRGDVARVFCAEFFGPTNTADGLQETVNVFYPSQAPTLILGSAGKDELRDIPLTDNIVFYGFGGNDSVRWQTGGQFFGGTGNDEVTGLTAGLFNGESGNNVAGAATANAEIIDATAVRENLPPLQPLGAFEVVGLDDFNTFIRWPLDAEGSFVIESLSSGRVTTVSSFDGEGYLRMGQRYGETITVNGRSILEFPDGVTLLSSEVTTTTFTKPTRDQLLNQLGGQLIRGPERFVRFQDATVSPDNIRWLSVTPSDIGSSASNSDVLIEVQAPDLTVVRSTTRQTIADTLGTNFETDCGVVPGESTYFVIAQTDNSVELFGFDASNLTLLWRRQLSSLPQFSSPCRYVTYSDGALYFVNSAGMVGWVDTVRVSETGEIDRVPAPIPELLNIDGINRLPSILSGAGTANGTTGITLLSAQRTVEAFPDYRQLIVVVHTFDETRTPSQVRILGDLVPTGAEDLLNGVLASATDGSNIWILAQYGEFEQTILQVDLASGNVLNQRRYEPADDIRVSGPIKVNNGVLEIGRNSRLIRIDAFTLDRLDDVKVVGEVTAFDEASVSTVLSDSDGVKAYSFAR